MGINKRGLWAVIISLVAIPLTVSLMGQGCSQGFNPAGTTSNLSSTLGSSPVCTTSSAAPIDKTVVVIPGAPTVSVSYGRQVLDSMVSCTGLGQPSTRALNEWTKRDQALSEYGNATDMSGAMMMAFTAIAGEVCRDLVNKEEALTSGSRSFFTKVDLTANQIAVADINSAVNLFAVACWNRNASAAEQATVASGISQLAANADLSALSVCTSMLSSLSAIVQ